MKTVVIRADGDSTIGLGHIMRCISLAEMISENHEVIFYALNPTVTVLNLIREYGFKCFALKEELHFFKSLSGTELVILDGYNFDESYQAVIKSKGCRLICIDDLASQSFVSDIILNHAPGIRANKYKASSDTKFLLGTEYALLRPIFLRQAKIKREYKDFSDLVICFGGADPLNLTLRVISLASKYSVFKKITVVTGNAYQHSSELIEYINDKEHIYHLHSLNQEELLKCFTSASMGIVPASGILFEAIACKLPVLSGCYTKNQEIIYKGFKELEAFYDASDFSVSSIKATLSRALQADPTEMIKQQSKCIDGNSPARITDALKAL